jgi:hypothetical protein
MRLSVQQPTRRGPRGSYPGGQGGHPRTRGSYRATGEFRPPLRGEFFLSGAIVEAYRAPNDLSTPYWIAEPDPAPPCPSCGRRP